MATDCREGNALQFEKIISLGQCSKFCACVLQKSLKTHYGYFSLQNFTWYLLLGISGTFCVWVNVLKQVSIYFCSVFFISVVKNTTINNLDISTFVVINREKRYFLVINGERCQFQLLIVNFTVNNRTM